MIKKVISVIAVCLIFFINVSADTAEDDFYLEQYRLSGADGLADSIPQETKEFLSENGIDPENQEWVNSLKAENVFSHIIQFIKSGAKAPFAGGGAILAIILVSAALAGFQLNSSTATAATYATALAAASAISVPAFSVITASVRAMQGCAIFMTSFIPIFAVLVASSGRAVTSASMSALLLTAAQVVSFISNFVIVPLMGGYMAISLASGSSPLIARSGIADGIKKLSFWIMSLLTTVFIGILSIQTAVNASADTLTLKTARFIIGSSVPVAGTALSEALTTVTASMGLLKSSVGIYGVVVCCAIFLPLIIELLLWRVVLILNASISDLFSVPKISGLLRSVDTVMSVMTGIILLTCALFVISLTVVVTAGKG